jgi:hypothetical protein
MTLYYCKNCPLTKDDCGPWDNQLEFKYIHQVHKDHKGFQEGEPRKIRLITAVEDDFNNYFDSVIDTLLHELISYEKSTVRSCLIKHKPWREIENWTL